MNVSLTDELENFVHQKVETGLYHSASEVVREGLRLLKERDELHQGRLEELRKAITVGVEQADRGRVKPFTQETAERIKSRGRERLAAEGRTKAR
jgi:antitoxin ParD1/3/4